MPATSPLPRHLRPRREKVFGPAQGIPLDRNAKARIIFYARAWNARHKQPRQHKGPITRTFMEVLETLVWGFHNSKDGRCFPSFDAIAAKAGCHRDTVNEAIKALEFAGILTWVNRIARITVRELDLFGRWVNRARIIRTSNSYLFRDPLPCAEVPEGHGSSKSENPSGTLNSDLSLPLAPCPTAKFYPDNPLERALIGLGRALGALPAEPAI